MSATGNLRRGDCSGWPGARLCMLLLLLVLATVAALSCLESPSPSQPAIEGLKLPAQGAPRLLLDVVSPPDEGRDHIWPDHPVEYQAMPPTSGPHFPDPTAPGFYTARPAYGYLVHSLEHGSVVIYYDQAKLTPEIEKSLKAFVEANSGPEVGIIAVPSADIKSAFTLTAWDKMLSLDKYDPLVIQAFLAEYLGRGPESPVR